MCFDFVLLFLSETFLILSTNERGMIKTIRVGLHVMWETAVAQWLRCCATNRNVAGSIPDGVIGIFH